ncbi:hypothetical protein KPH14_011919 [Odynerus spinipes]|uniref:CCHC-type domain-containing protein n=1 Tax=Odynerus spinipes TaxID=1348599 RepID=A0AAD9VLP5_9HYME|nr:hypothetical protein KPH14_011919 [Odynerus spinipes]
MDQENSPNRKPSNPTSSQITRSYASAATNNIFSSKDHAIIIDSVDGATMKDYAYAVANITGSNAIRFASRIFNGRICVYLDSKNTAISFTSNHKTLSLNNAITTARPLLNPSQRIILSNVSPSISHDQTEAIFQKNNIRISSKKSFLRAGIQVPGFFHVMSFRRPIFVNPEDAPKIPESFLINHDGNQYRIFSSTDKVNCFLCKQEGHIASQCDKLTKNISPNTNEDKRTDNPHNPYQTINNETTDNLNCSNSINEELKISSDITIEPEVKLTENPDYSPNKRPLSISSSNHLENEDNNKSPTPEPNH